MAFAFTGEGSEWGGMGQALYESEPVVRAVLDRCDAVLREERGASLLDAMFGQTSAEGALGDPAWTQPAICTRWSVHLTALWASVGIQAERGGRTGSRGACSSAGGGGIRLGGRACGLRWRGVRDETMEGIAVGAAIAHPS